MGAGEFERHAAISDDVDRGNRFATIGYSVGGTLLLTGAVMLLWPESTTW